MTSLFGPLVPWINQRPKPYCINQRPQPLRVLSVLALGLCKPIIISDQYSEATSCDCSVVGPSLSLQQYWKGNQRRNIKYKKIAETKTTKLLNIATRLLNSWFKATKHFYTLVILQPPYEGTNKDAHIITWDESNTRELSAYHSM